MTILLLRHAAAVRRADWHEADLLRPLTVKGYAQAAGLIDVLGKLAPQRIVSSPYVRCIESVEPLRAHLVRPVLVNDDLAEGTDAKAAALVDVDRDEVVLLCSHGDVIPALLTALAPDADLGPDPRCEKGSTWVIERGGRSVRYLPPPETP
jgi:8-oxo-dGTP diphosphatase